MILPFAAPVGFTSGVQPPAEGPSGGFDEGKACWFVFSKGQLLVRQDKRSIPTRHEFHWQRTLYLGTLHGTNLFAGEVEDGSIAPAGCLWSPLRPLHATLDAEILSIAGYAMQLLHWDRTNKFCGNCGNCTAPRSYERCRECKSCGHLAYPKLSPAVLALVTRGKQILLARNPQFSEPFYSPLAGFVDPGETLEQCVIREIFEEVGIRVQNVCYLASQPWPFSYSLMIGFSCEWREGEIQINPDEIMDAAWFDVSNLPKLPPMYSLSRILVEEFIRSNTGRN
jgi:NAD+ diphosphatase